MKNKEIELATRIVTKKNKSKHLNNQIILNNPFKDSKKDKEEDNEKRIFTSSNSQLSTHFVSRADTEEKREITREEYTLPELNKLIQYYFKGTTKKTNNKYLSDNEYFIKNKIFKRIVNKPISDKTPCALIVDNYFTNIERKIEKNIQNKKWK